MSTLHKGGYQRPTLPTDLIAWESHPTYSRETRNIAATAEDRSVVLGQVLAENADGDLVEIDLTAAAPLNVPAAVLAQNVTVRAGTPQPAGVIDALARLRVEALTFGENPTPAQTAAVVDGLRAIGIKVS